MAADKHVHTSKVDPWLAAIVLASAVASSGVIVFVSRADPQRTWPLTGSLCAVWLAITSVTWPMLYIIDQDMLTVRCGLLKWKIPLTSIQEVAPTSTPISSPAWSLDRLLISYVKGDGRDSLCISPLDKDGFVEDLVVADPNLLIVGDHKICRRGLEGL